MKIISAALRDTIYIYGTYISSLYRLYYSNRYRYNDQLWKYLFLTHNKSYVKIICSVLVIPMGSENVFSLLIFNLNY